MSNNITKAIILCSNRSTTLVPLTHYLSRSMLPVLNKPAIFWQLVFLRRAGIKEVFLCIDTDCNDLINYISSVSIPGLQISYHLETNPSGTAGCLRYAKDFLEGQDFVVIP